MNEKKQQVLKKFEAARVQVQKKMEHKMKKVQDRFAKKLKEEAGPKKPQQANGPRPFQFLKENMSELFKSHPEFINNKPLIQKLFLACQPEFTKTLKEQMPLVLEANRNLVQQKNEQEKKKEDFRQKNPGAPKWLAHLPEAAREAILKKKQQAPQKVSFEQVNEKFRADCELKFRELKAMFPECEEKVLMRVTVNRPRKDLNELVEFLIENQLV